MKRKKQLKLIAESIKVFGVEGQFRQFHEEVGELMVAISHYRRKRCDREELMVEMADVLQMIDALRAVFNIDEEAFKLIQDQQWKKLKKQIKDTKSKKRK